MKARRIVQRPMTTSLLCGCIGGIAGALLAAAVGGIDTPTEPRAAPTSELAPLFPDEGVHQDRLSALEAEVQGLRMQLTAIAARPVASADPNGETRLPLRPESDPLSERIADALAAEHQEVLERQIGLAQQQDSALVDEFAEQVGLSAATRDALEAIYFDVTAEQMTVIDSAKNGTSSWEEARAEMEELWESGRQRVKELLPPRELDILVSVGKRHSTLLHLPAAPAAETVAEGTTEASAAAPTPMRMQ